jgi:catechol 2,3-dioxygenase-like lactoylglutathione lyase family enzyme
MSYIIGGIQQLGVGTPDESASCRWYADIFGMNTPIFREAAPAPFMTRYTGGEVQSRSATLALNLQGEAVLRYGSIQAVRQRWLPLT